jgi:predicted nucleic acid-binding protein
LITYVETSAAAKLMFNEAESPDLKAFLDQVADQGEGPWSSMLLETELRRAAVRTGATQELVTDVLERFDLVEPDRTIYREAGLLGGADLRWLDALHVVTALRLGADRFVTYDKRQEAAASSAGLRIIAP